MRQTRRSALGLRHLAPTLVARRNSLLEAGVAQLSLAHLDRAERYVVMDTRLNAQQCCVFIALQQLIDYWLGEATLPAHLMDEAITWRFVKDAFLQDGLPTPSSDLLWQMPARLAREEDYDTPLLRLAGEAFDIYLPELPGDFRDECTVLHPELSVVMQLTLGPLHLPASALCSVDAGDVIRLPGQTGTASVAGQPLFIFQIDGDSLMIETSFFDGQPATPPATADHHGDLMRGALTETETEAGLSLGHLPVAVSFVLNRCDMRVAQLCTLKPGMTLPFAQSTPYVDVMAGTLRLARGELVRVGDELGVELLEVFSPGAAHQDDGTP